MGCCTEDLEICVIEDSAATVRARIRGSDGELLEAADVSAITFKIFKPDNTQQSTGSLTPGDVLFVPLVDSSIGQYNFEWEIPGSNFPAPTTGTGRYTIELFFTPAVGDPFYLDPIAVKVVGVLTS